MLSIYGTEAFGDYSIVRIEQKTGDPTDGDLLSLVTADAEAHVDNLVMANGTDDYATWRMLEAGTLTLDLVSDGTPEFIIADETTLTPVNAAGGSLDALTLSGTLGNFDGSDTFRGLFLDYVKGSHTGTTNNTVILDIDAIAGDAETNTYAIRIGNMTGTTGSASEVEQAIEIGTGWDAGIDFVDDTAKIIHSGATSLDLTSTSGTVTIEGNTTFTGANVTNMGTLGSGAITSTGLVQGQTLSSVNTEATLTLDDSDGADGFIKLNATDAVDSKMTMGVDDSGGDDQEYIELDGVAETVDILQAFTVAGTTTLSDNVTIADTKTLTFDESAADPNDADITISAADGILTIIAICR